MAIHALIGIGPYRPTPHTKNIATAVLQEQFQIMWNRRLTHTCALPKNIIVRENIYRIHKLPQGWKDVSSAGDLIGPRCHQEPKVEAPVLFGGNHDNAYLEDFRAPGRRECHYV